MSRAARGLRSPHRVSLRTRVVATAAATLAVALLVLAVVIGGVLGVAGTRVQNAVLSDRMQLAEELAAAGTSPPELLARVDNRSVRARLTLADGRTLGLLPRAGGPAGDVRTRQARLTGPGELNGAELTLQLDGTLLTGVRVKVRRALVLTTLAAVLIGLLALPFAVGRALAPLDTMTTLARSITAGRRGERLAPAGTGTELARAATAFNAMLDALEGAEARAQASEQRIRRFVGDAAHELRTPITGIAAIAEAALHQPVDSDPEQRQRMQLLLVREARRAGRLVDDMLELARIDAGLSLRAVPTDLHELAAVQRERARVAYPQLQVGLAGDAAPVVADPERTSQVLANLVENAAQAAGPNGRVDLTVRVASSGAEVLVTDNGPGVPAAERDRIFDRLVRLDTARERNPDGSGLGLAIARGLARAHGGELSCVDPPAGTGAAFRLWLPVTPSADLQFQRQDSETSDPRSKESR
ncbi:sensor histidine kinase [Skermania piniformis]|uniref:histidine kinase n=1 Tax=Skermania pinensis TaxID=39122 RepID=A0ABX8S7M1_9ACTN|nr:HAMP domain-containing sensor histidine kinase [Skermania piniformis]QXQ13840.1 HAMP domain-containing histidine kinase [Skermania piniformis]